ncbi:CHASE domain-containing protein [Paraglaciecola sp. 25GB23A]|uniref:CHASE domain-containing protein n=1 Tax=Paraglaciecola sp. 25GB23A TaxID=3156068 RepID=UPI0032B004A1
MSNAVTSNIATRFSMPWYIIAFFSYFLGGVLLSNIATQSQIVPIWIPAAIALVGCYIWWWRFFPAVFIASLLFNISTHKITGLPQITPELMFEGLLISSGATLQAIVGSAIMRYWLGNPLALKTDQRTITFVFVVGVLVNLISANIGVFALSQFSPSYSVENYWNNMFLWWMGDSLGVLIGLPFILSLVRFTTLAQQTRKSRLLIINISCILLVMISLSTVFFSKYNYNNALALAKRELQTIENGVNGEISKNQAQLQQLARFLQTNPQVTRQQFTQFAEKLLTNKIAMKALSWNSVVEQNDSEQFKDELNEIYQRPISIVGKPLGEGDPLVVVKYIAPEQSNEAAIGFNVYSSPARKTALLKDQDIFGLHATPIIQLVQSSKAMPAYLLFSAVFSEHTKQSSVPQKADIRGYATGVFLIDQMLTQALPKALSDIFHYELFDQGSTQVFAGNTQKDMISLQDEVNLMSLSFNMSGQIWQMNLVPKREFLIHYQSDLSTLLYIFQIVIVAFSMTLLLLMNNRQFVLNHLVEQRTNELVLAKQEADQANKAKGQFLANMSHELRTPLNAVIGFAQLAKKTDKSEQLRAYINNIASASGTLLALINDILDFSKIESNKLSLETSPFDMEALIGRIDVMFSANASNKNIEWRIENTLPAPLWFKGDSLRLEQIVINLCGNALKFTQKGRVTLHFSVQSEQQTYAPGAQVNLKIAVKDSGIGMTEQQQGKLFNAFNQADNSTTRKYGGTGLGLAISLKLCELMKGSFEVSSTPEVGSIFTLSVPLEVCLPITEVTTASDFDISSLQNKKVLVAEDNEINQIVITEMLKHLGLKAVIVENGQSAVEAVNECLFDVVLMDCQMPILDGYQATTQIREHFNQQQLPVIALTADVTHESKEKAEMAGFNAHLSKPISLEKLTACLLNVLAENKKSEL